MMASAAAFESKTQNKLGGGDQVMMGDSFVNIGGGFQRQQPPSLPPQPPGLTAEQVKRRHIISSIVQSENSYVSAVQRLVKVLAS
jgi:hypothetical protein